MRLAWILEEKIVKITLLEMRVVGCHWSLIAFSRLATLESQQSQDSVKRGGGPQIYNTTFWDRMEKSFSCKCFSIYCFVSLWEVIIWSQFF